MVGTKFLRKSESTPDGHVRRPRGNPAIAQAVNAGVQKYTNIRVPVLAVFALPAAPGQLFYDGDKPAEPPKLPKRAPEDNREWGSTGKDSQVLGRFRRLFPAMKESNRTLLIHLAQKMAQPTRHRASS
jgi:hypothetical protein